MSDLEIPMSEFTLSRGDTAPAIDAFVTDDAGEAIDLTGATGVTFSMWSVDDLNTAVINAAGASVVAPGTLGLIRYSWAEGDTDTPGNYLGRFALTLNGERMSVPGGGWVLIRISR
jgi:hypothetical protein